MMTACFFHDPKFTPMQMFTSMFTIKIFWPEFDYLITSTLFNIYFSRQTNPIILKEKTKEQAKTS